MSFRRQQLNSLIRNEIVIAIQKEVEFPSGCLATVTRVEIDNDLDKAAVFVSVIPSDKKDGALRALKAKRAELQTILFKRIKIMSLPQIYFEYDAGPEKSANIERIVLDDEEKGLFQNTGGSV